MSPRWEEWRDPPPPPPPEALLMDAVLSPNRSLSRRGLALVLGGVAVVNAIFAIVMAAQGAYPVLPFLGLDVLLLWFAFRMNNRAGRREERVRVAADRIHVTRLAPKRAPKHYLAHPAWTRVEEAPEAVRVAAGGRFVALGAFLSPDERRDFARALSHALSRAKSGG